MVTNKAPMFVLAWIVGSGLAWAQDDAEATPELVEEAPSVTEHEIVVRNAYMKVFVASGYYDMATPS